MAWNKYYIVVTAQISNDLDEILSHLNLGQYKPVKEVPLHYSNKPETLFAGFYKDNLLLVHPDLPFDFFSETQTETEKLFIDTFPDSEIAVLIENSTSDLFGYVIIDRGKKVRMKDGADGEIFHDEGELLPEEKEIFSENIFDDDEMEEMREEGMSEEELDAMIKFEAYWRVPDRISKRYFGEPVGQIDSGKILVTIYE